MKTGLLVLRGQENQHLSCFPAEQNLVWQRRCMLDAKSFVYHRRFSKVSTQITLRVHRRETTVQQSWENEHVETELDKKKIIFFSLNGLFLTRPNIPNIFNYNTWLLASEFNLHRRISQYFTVHNQLMRKKETKEDRKRTQKFHWNWNLFSRIADVAEGTIPKLSGYWHKL